MAGDMLVAAPARWDEACFAVPAVRALIASGLKTGVLCRAEQLDFWHTLPGLQVMPTPRKSRDAVAMVRSLWQAAILWEKGESSDVIIKAGVPRLLGPAGSGLGKRLTHPLSTVPGPLEHRVRYYLTALEEMGIATDKPEFFSAADVLFERISRSIMLSPESDFGPNYEWPGEHWLEIGRRLVNGGWRVTVSQARGGRNACARELANALGSGVEFLDAREPGASFKEIAIHPTVLAADGSLPHLAAHLGATCVTLFGPNDPAWRRPMGKRHAVLWQHVECAPCLLPKCPLDHRCVRELDPERVWRTVQEKLPTNT